MICPAKCKYPDVDCIHRAEHKWNEQCESSCCNSKCSDVPIVFDVEELFEEIDI